MPTLMTQDAELARLRAENARLAAALQQEQDARARLEHLALQLGKDKAKLEKELAALDHKYQQLRQRLFGRSSEKIDQEELERAVKEEEAREQAEAAANATPPHAAEAPDGETPTLPPEQPTKKEKKGHGRRRRQKIARQERVVHEPRPEELVCPCCGGQKKSIGSDEITKRYEYRPASLVEVEHVRPRFRCAKCQDGTTMAPLPPAPIVPLNVMTDL